MSKNTTGAKLQEYIISNPFIMSMGFGVSSAQSLYPAKREFFFQPHANDGFTDIEKAYIFFNVDETISFGDKLTIYVKKRKNGQSYSYVANYILSEEAYNLNMSEELYQENPVGASVLSSLVNIATQYIDDNQNEGVE